MVHTDGSYRVPRSLALFHGWFASRFYDLVSDQGQEARAHYEVDESFLEDLRSVINDSSES